jgi:hypothetical protein
MLYGIKQNFLPGEKVPSKELYVKQSFMQKTPVGALAPTGVCVMLLISPAD